MRGVNPRILLLCYAVQARIQCAAGKIVRARATVAQARRMVEEHGLPRRYANEVNTLEVKFWLSQGENERAAEWVMSAGLQPTDEDVAGKEGQYRLLARVMAAQRELEGAVQLLQRLYESASRAGKILSQIETLAHTAAVEMELGRERAALATLQKALTLAEAEGNVRTFLDEGAPMGRLLHLWVREARQRTADATLDAYAARLLAAWQAQEAAEQKGVDVSPEKTLPEKAKAAQPLVEPLSDRELEVLQLVAQGLSDRQIAERLIIVPGTVKRHLNSLYGKLDVHSRTQAVARARQFALIDE
jgi:LuxR family maltose regulon positive regulatory protein